ncbi:MAG: hypothetical protein A4E56_00380 [Pelotomaculum sp. PtaU1.Bin065]|nr:MAG: hypothetical protein A4E56_00380 [Pelotomaculum sp. PtaU1.Bin065]
MERFQLENLYTANGITDYRLRNTDDLFKVHGINFKTVNGYDLLDDVNKLLYEKFIVNYFNNFGLDTRLTLIPLGIYFVEHIHHSIKQVDEDGEYFLEVAGVVKSIDKDGKKKVIHRWEDKEYKQIKRDKEQSETYLRFEYKIFGKKEWQHVVSEKAWY